MATEIIELLDGTLVEVESSQNQTQQIGGSASRRVSTALESIRPILLRVCQSINNFWKDPDENLIIEKAEIQVGFGFEGEGNLYITKTKANANLLITLSIKPPRQNSPHR